MLLSNTEKPNLLQVVL